ncbi:MAG: tetratricopeptide repeat protein, partial [bacterium]|nr:tetratricopeptide repeat protein [bacterium]
TWESAVALIDAAIPFTLATVGPEGAHLQAVIGYDSYRHSLLIRDPTEPHFGEFRAKEMLEHFSPTGPRAMVMVPADRAELLDGVELPEAELYDMAYRLEKALERHDRQQAAEVHREMQQIDPDHRLTIHSRGVLADYDADVRTMLRCCERHLKRFPDDVNQMLARIGCLRDFSDAEERLQLLKDCCAKKDSHPLLWCRYAAELSSDARRFDEVTYWLRRLLRYRPTEVRAFGLMADTLWEQQLRDQAMWLYRFAACLDDKDESRAKQFFIAARAVGQTDDAVRLLTARLDRAGNRSSLPAMTLCWAYEQLDLTEKAVDVIEQALRQRPDDGDLKLFAADLFVRCMKQDRADEQLQQARGRTHSARWLRTAAYMALFRGELQTGLDYWRQVHEAEPLAPDANDMVATLLADVEGREAAVEFVRAAVEQYPHSYSLRQTLIEWLRHDDPAVEETALREMIELHPVDPWGRRELALVLGRQGRWEEAEEESELAGRLEPSNPLVDYVRGRAAAARGDIDAAKAALRDSICKSVDYEQAIAELMRVCDTKAERVEQLQFIRQQHTEQVIHGDGLLLYREYAATAFDPEQVLEHLQEAIETREDLWFTWVALAQQLVQMERTDEALELARRGVERFPLLPRMWLELAMVCRSRNDADGEKDALARALQINPSWGDAARELAAVHNRLGQWEQSQAILERAVALDPREARNHGCLADVLWHGDDREAAVARLETAVRLAPGYDWAWNALRQWSAEIDQPDRAVEMAQELCELHPNEALSWFTLAQVLEDPQRVEQRLEALDRAAALNPRNSEIHDMRAYCLAEQGRFDEALDACHPDIFADQVPIDLRARAADVEAMRGNMDEAVRCMRQVVEDDADYFWAWTKLAEWHDGSENHAAYREAAQQMVRLAPQHAPAWGFLGDAKLRTNDRAGAKSDFRRAVEIAPDYTFAVIALFDLLIEDKKPDDAAQIAAMAAPHHDDDFRLALEVRIAAQREDRETAADLLGQLCGCPMQSDAALSMAVGHMYDLRMYDEIETVLDAHIGGAEPNPCVVVVWVDLYANRGTLQNCFAGIEQWDHRQECWLVASERLIEQLTRTTQTKVLKQYVKRNASRLQIDNRTWGAVAEAMLDLDLYDDLIRWQRDWQSREVAESWTVFPLVMALWSRRKVDDAATVGQWALQAEPDRTTNHHRLWRATAALLDTDVDSAATLLDGIDSADLGQFHNDICRLASELMTILASVNAPDATLSFRAAGQRLRDVYSRSHSNTLSDALAKWLYQRCRWRLAKQYNRPVAAAWATLVSYFG